MIIVCVSSTRGSGMTAGTTTWRTPAGGAWTATSPGRRRPPTLTGSTCSQGATGNVTYYYYMRKNKTKWSEC